MKIEGRCHCGNISFVLDWPGEGLEFPVRACGCDFCTKHGGVWTSNSDAKLNANINDESLVSIYQFETGTADYYICTRCGIVPFVTSNIEGNLYAVVNVNTFENIDPSVLDRSPASFDGESTEQRLERRKRNWIGTVNI